MSNHSEMELRADGFELLQIDVRSLMGEGFLLGIPASNTGKDLQSMIALQIPQKPGCHISLQHESKKLSLRKSLKEQGFHGEVTLCYVYTRVDLLAAWKYLNGNLFLEVREKPLEEEDIVLEGITRIHGIENLTFGMDFNRSVGKRRFARQFAKLKFWQWFQPEPGESDFARHFAKLDFWQQFQPKSGEGHFARQFAKLDFWLWLRQSLENVTLPTVC